MYCKIEVRCMCSSTRSAWHDMPWLLLRLCTDKLLFACFDCTDWLIREKGSCA